jgi:hypothetical protein
MTTALVSGAGQRANELADRLREAGHDVSLHDPAAGGSPSADHVDYYLQLPITVTLDGDSLVARVHSFLSGGLLARFALVEQLLPGLSRGARVVLVSGTTTDSAAALPDDQHSRLALLHVLAHAAKAELAERDVRVQVVSGDRSDEEIVDYLLHGGEDTSVRLLDETAAPSSKQYEDWRTEVMGLMSPVTA